MTPKKYSGKAVWAVSAAVIVVALLLILLFVMGNPADPQESIVLPPAQETAPAETIQPSDKAETEDESDFFHVTNENVLLALQSLKRPASYHQTYTVTVGADEIQAVRQVELWVNGPLIHAEVFDEQQVQSVISNGQTAWLWYGDGPDTVSVKLTDGMTIEDLLGLPQFDSYLTLSSDSVVDAGYLVLDDPKIQCIYVSAETTESHTARYWVDLETGLLYQSDVLEESNQVYTLRQASFEVLATEDETFRDRFILPDGTVPFTAAEESPLPG